MTEPPPLDSAAAALWWYYQSVSRALPQAPSDWTEIGGLVVVVQSMGDSTRRIDRWNRPPIELVGGGLYRVPLNVNLFPYIIIFAQSTNIHGVRCS